MTYQWTAEKEDQFRRLWNGGEPLYVIERTMRISQATVDKLRRRLGLEPRRAPDWSDEDIELIKRRWLKGDSAAQIAAGLHGRTRNSVIGKLHRLGLSNHGRAAPSAPRRTASAPAVRRTHVRPPKPGPQNKPAVIHGDLAPSSEAQRLARLAEGRTANDTVATGVAVQSPNARPWMENRKINECSWPIGDRYDIRSCCNPVKARGWCEGHLAVGLAPMHPKALRPRDAGRLTRFDRVERDGPVKPHTERSIWDEGRAA